MAGLYIHIPFCESRCIYCGFYSTTTLNKREDYVDALCREMELRPIQQELGCNESIQTIYLGGGTPSQLSAQQLIKLFDAIKQNYNYTKDMEITMECNPDDVTEEFCETLRQFPINRISMGAQTFSDQRLRFLHRRHTAQEVTLAIKRLRNIGIKNISIDLMYGFPNETLADWQSDIEQAIQLNVEHISAYCLMYEEGTALYRMLTEGKIKETEEETTRQMYEMLITRLTQAGYEHYEISNFARPGYYSRHNNSYWHEVAYIGLGAAAHSYRRLASNLNTTDKEDKTKYSTVSQKYALVERSWNVENIQKYIDCIKQGQLPSEKEELDINTRFNELIMTALRTQEGIDLEKMKQEFGLNLYQKLIEDSHSYISQDMIKIDGNHLSLTNKGIFISDYIMSDLMIV